MIYKISGNSLEEMTHDSSYSELKIESLIIPERELELFHENIFNEDLMFISNQRTLKNTFKHDTSTNRLDVLAVDRHGNGVIIEIKKNTGYLGMETQALFYLSSISPYTGLSFLRLGLGKEPSEEQIRTVREFLNCPLESLNKSSRILLLANTFNPAVFSLGTWLNNANCSFKAISYHVTQIGNEKFIQFSTQFEAHPKDYFGLTSLKKPLTDLRRTSPSIFWHNIGISDQTWWDYLIRENIITASYDNENSPLSKGYQVMNQYVKDDITFAFAGGYGVVGYGKMTGKPGYKYKDHKLENFRERHFHTHSIQWIKTVPLENAVPAAFLKEIGLNHPTQTKQEIRQNQPATDLLIKKINERASIKDAA